MEDSATFDPRLNRSGPARAGLPPVPAPAPAADPRVDEIARKLDRVLAELEPIKDKPNQQVGRR